jgi:hypothetical protein
MEVITLSGLIGLGYVVSRLTEKKGGSTQAATGNAAKPGCKVPTIPGKFPKSEFAEPFRGAQQQQQQQREGFMPAARGPSSTPLVLNPKGSSAVGYGPNLDLMYSIPAGGDYQAPGDMADGRNQYPYGPGGTGGSLLQQFPVSAQQASQMFPSEPQPGPYGMPLAYASQRPPLAPTITEPGPSPVAMEGNRPMVEMRSDNIEETPQYVDNFVVSPLSGARIPATEFTHNNMQPFFGARMRQNMDSTANTARLDMHTGAGSTQIAKREIEPMFNTGQTPFGNPFGMEDNTDFVQSRINAPRNRAGERPFEPVKVGPGLGQDYGSLGEGGFQQFEVNEVMRNAMKDTNELRVATNPKLSYTQPVIPGARFIANASEDAGEVRKYRPDKFYVDETGERFFVTTGDVIKEAARPTQILNYTTRPETSTEYGGIAASQDYQEGYVAGAYRTPMTQQYGGAGFRNADMTTYYTSDVGQSEGRDRNTEGFQGGQYVPNDYGRGSYENKDNERTATSERMMGLNLAPVEAGALTVHYDDPSRPTRRAEMVGNIRQAGVATGYANGAPAVTVWDPTDIARTTIKEGTVKWDYLGNMAPASAPTRLKVYDPDDIAKPTQKSQLSKRDYYGIPVSSHQNHTDHAATENMRLNPNKQDIAKRRKPYGGNGGIAVFTGDVNQTTRKLDSDYVNDRPNAGNRVESLPPGAGDIGRVKYRHPLQQDIYTQRTQPEFVSAVEQNPLNVSLRANAERDEQNVMRRYAEMMGSQGKK